MRRTAETATDPLNRRVPADTARAQATYRFGFWIALVTSVLTVITFALALTAIPNDVPYPFTSDVIVEQWPGDYLWMYPAMLLMLLFVALVASVHEYAPPRGRSTACSGSASRSAPPPCC
jgi:hypothetical protein